MKRILIPGDCTRFANYHQAIQAAGGLPVWEGDAEGLLLPGGGDVEPWRYGEANTTSQVEPGRDEGELGLLEAFLAAGKPVLGICRGMQLINVCFGGSLHQHITGHDQQSGQDRRHLVTLTGPLKALAGAGQAEVNSAHHQGVKRLGAGLQALAWAPDGLVEAVRHEGAPVLALQWHPERLGQQTLFQAFLDWDGGFWGK